MCDNQCLSFVGVLLGKALKTIFLENYPYSSYSHTELELETEDQPSSSVTLTTANQFHIPLLIS
ncbi:MAG: hypothetical protein EWV81_16425 [Microcystis aeruginosa Ma_SC_T_19800800_S464]|uniref:Uncharacterized protein n=1 Tax=Microcystis aeruginosa Ma_SC_T_19800800_S464 TaxID=2486257 RepID=A0A552DM11_MICAE|nr:MAG: hypothetical protein EWV81_16425 [Microcystis aeruginosa Ma_SC_T_19800800_S464]